MEKSTCIAYLVLCIILLLILIFKIKSKDNFGSDVHFHDKSELKSLNNFFAVTNNQIIDNIYLYGNDKKLRIFIGAMKQIIDININEIELKHISSDKDGNIWGIALEPQQQHKVVYLENDIDNIGSNNFEVQTNDNLKTGFIVISYDGNHCWSIDNDTKKPFYYNTSNNSDSINLDIFKNTNIKYIDVNENGNHVWFLTDDNYFIYYNKTTNEFSSEEIDLLSDNDRENITINKMCINNDGNVLFILYDSNVSTQANNTVLYKYISIVNDTLYIDTTKNNPWNQYDDKWDDISITNSFAGIEHTTKEIIYKPKLLGTDNIGIENKIGITKLSLF